MIVADTTSQVNAFPHVLLWMFLSHVSFVTVADLTQTLGAPLDFFVARDETGVAKDATEILRDTNLFVQHLVMRLLTAVTRFQMLVHLVTIKTTKSTASTLKKMMSMSLLMVSSVVKVVGR